jgi:hypothetical protein
VFSPRRLLLPGVLFFLLALVALAPARLLGWVLPPDTLVADGFAGSLWRGSAARAVVITPAGPVHLGALRWRLAPLSLLRLQPAMRVQSRWGEQFLDGRLRRLGAGRWRLEDGSLAGDAALLQELAPVAVRGRLSGQLARLDVAAGLPVYVEGRLAWERAAWEVPSGGFALGSYALDCATSQGVVTGEVLTLAGPLEAAGRLSLDGRRYRAVLDLGSERPLAAPLANALALLATPTDSGFRLELEGELQTP